MTEEERDQKIAELHDFFMEAKRGDRPSRAEQIDKLLDTVWAGKLLGRIILYVCGAVITVGTAVATWRGWFSQ